MIIYKTLWTQLIRIGIFRTDYQLSGKITLENLNTLSQGTHIITGYQYLTPVYLIEKPDDIQISGILDSDVIWVTYPEKNAHYVEDYLSALLTLIPENQSSGSFIITYYRDIKNYLFLKLRKNRYSNPEFSEIKELIVD
ncbi:hypothetical protein ACKUB1_03165 [Methanospirillum stamsii]|uniref:Uncharacterized protein n=1 Tax=Methanospirillum stamsii TaxID=1277351 RepID=A0A2V2N7B4_9EURY|nr:hypothetical protein [Methanospirillum stamsii]PWR71153.1 hypothetical protein DLD82_13860 [Methanospirillum stamsii]